MGLDEAMLRSGLISPALSDPRLIKSAADVKCTIG